MRVMAIVNFCQWHKLYVEQLQIKTRKVEGTVSPAGPSLVKKEVHKECSIAHPNAESQLQVKLGKRALWSPRTERKRYSAYSIWHSPNFKIRWNKNILVTKSSVSKKNWLLCSECLLSSEGMNKWLLHEENLTPELSRNLLPGEKYQWKNYLTTLLKLCVEHTLQNSFTHFFAPWEERTSI